MADSSPLISGLTTSDFTGKTYQLNSRGNSAAFRSFTVNRSQEYNFTIANPQMQVDIVNAKGEVVTSITSENSAADAHARLAPGDYQAVISQRYKGVNNKDYDLTISERSTATITAGGGILKGQARAGSATDSGVQKHTLNVAQGGSFDIQTTMPYTRWSIMDKDGKVVASGDTMTPDANSNYLTSKPQKLDPGTYEVVMVLPRNVEGTIPWNLSFTPKTDIPQVAAKQGEIERILAERDARLQQWAAEDAAKASQNQKSS